MTKILKKLSFLFSFCFIVLNLSVTSQTNIVNFSSTSLEKISLNDTVRVNDLLQQQKKEYDALYGLDFDLFSGKKYYPILKKDSGHPFWNGDQPHIGRLTMNGKTFNHLKLLYDINKHNFVLEYIDLNGATSRLILNSQQIDKVEINENIFVKNKFNQIEYPFIQHVYKGTLACYFTWNKEYSFKNTGRITGYIFSEEIRTIYIDFNDEIKKIKNNKSILKLFNKENRKMVSNYLSKNKVNVKKAELPKIKQLIEYCNTIL